MKYKWYKVQLCLVVFLKPSLVSCWQILYGHLNLIRLILVWFGLVQLCFVLSSLVRMVRATYSIVCKLHNMSLWSIYHYFLFKAKISFLPSAGLAGSIFISWNAAVEWRDHIVCICRYLFQTAELLLHLLYSPNMQFVKTKINY